MSGPESVERYQWRRNAEGDQQFGNQMEIRPLDEESFRGHLASRLRPGWGETLAEHQCRVPSTTHYRVVRFDDSGGWCLTGIGSLEELQPSELQSPWALRVEAFESAEARAWGSVADSDAKVLTVDGGE